jgi:tetrahydromethanopterin S-methyltransferase subunit G
MTTSPGTDYVTKSDFDLAMARIDASFVNKSEFELAMARIDSRFDVLEARLEARIEQAMVTSIRWTVGVSFSLYALMFGLILFIIARELSHA